MKYSLCYDDLVTVEPLGLSGGLVVMWKNSFDVEMISKDKRIIDLKVRMGSINFFLSCVYGDPVRARRQIVWDRLSDIGRTRDETWILIGDSNKLMSNTEKLGGAVISENVFLGFRNMAENCKVKEIRSSGNVEIVFGYNADWITVLEMMDGFIYFLE